MAPRARHARGKARIGAYEELLAQDEREQLGTAEILIPKGPRLRKDVVVCDAVEKGYGDNLLMDGLAFALIGHGHFTRPVVPG